MHIGPRVGTRLGAGRPHGRQRPEIVGHRRHRRQLALRVPARPGGYVTFATNAIVFAYDPYPSGGRAVRDTGESGWFEPLLEDTATLGRTDPALDPLGYRTLFTLELATECYELSTNLREAIPDREQLYPETQLLGQCETGSIDAAFVYRSMAIKRDYDHVDLPQQSTSAIPRTPTGTPGHSTPYETAE